MYYSTSKTTERLRFLAGAKHVPEHGYWTLPDGSHYVVSVLRPDDAIDLCDSVALVVVVDGDVRTPIWVGETGPFPGAFTFYETVRVALRQPNVEVHVHAVAPSATERREVAEAFDRAMDEPAAIRLAA